MLAVGKKAILNPGVRLRLSLLQLAAAKPGISHKSGSEDRMQAALDQRSWHKGRRGTNKK
jgi:hypothetical protein